MICVWVCISDPCVVSPCNPLGTACTPVTTNVRNCDCIGDGQPINGDAAANGCSGGNFV